VVLLLHEQLSVLGRTCEVAGGDGATIILRRCLAVSDRVRPSRPRCHTVAISNDLPIPLFGSLPYANQFGKHNRGLSLRWGNPMIASEQRPYRAQSARLISVSKSANSR